MGEYHVGCIGADGTANQSNATQSADKGWMCKNDLSNAAVLGNGLSDIREGR